MSENKKYIAIDLKSFYASVECIERGLNPLDTNLVVADKSRTTKTICLAVSPSLKEWGIPGRPRLFQVVEDVNELNMYRAKQLRDLYDSIDATGRRAAVSRIFTKSSTIHSELLSHPEYKLDYIIAPPQMAKYLKVSTQIYNIYLDFISAEDIHVYSIDEVFIDATPYLKMYNCTAKKLAEKIIHKVLSNTGITATVGIGTNMYLAKIAMDIHAKKMPADENGVRIAELDEMSYRRILWNHRPISDFWMIGPGYTKRLETYGMHTMGDIARCSVENEDLLYDIFGINAELLIDHAWGWEPCTIADVKSYKPVTNSLSHGQVLWRPYKNQEGLLVLRELAEELSMELTEKELLTKKLVIHVGYDIKNLVDIQKRTVSTSGVHGYSGAYTGEIKEDYLGRKLPKYARCTVNLEKWTSSSTIIREAITKAYNKVVDKELLIRRFNISAEAVLPKKYIDKKIKSDRNKPIQLNFFTNYELEKLAEEKLDLWLEKEHNLQKTMLAIKNKFGPNSLLKASNLKEDSTAKFRNTQIGGHKA